MVIRWLTAVLEVPVGDLEAALRFWNAVTAARAMPSEGSSGESVTLTPDAGDAYLRIEGGTTSGGCRLEVHTDDPERMAETAVGHGARHESMAPGFVALQSPSGLHFDVVVWDGRHRRPSPRSWPDGQRSLLDQLCIDIPTDAFDAECDFWAALTGWEHRAGGAAEFRYLPRPAGMPLRLLLQRLDDPSRGSARAHLDLACSDTTAECRRHQTLGAAVQYRGRVWTTLRDPASIAYCITSRDPETGTL